MAVMSAVRQLRQTETKNTIHHRDVATILILGLWGRTRANTHERSWIEPQSGYPLVVSHRRCVLVASFFESE